MRILDDVDTRRLSAPTRPRSPALSTAAGGPRERCRAGPRWGRGCRAGPRAAAGPRPQRPGRGCASAHAPPRRRPARRPRTRALRSRATTWNGISLAWDSQNVENTRTPRSAAMAAVSATMRLLPIPGGPTTPTTHPEPVIDRRQAGRPWHPPPIDAQPDSWFAHRSDRARQRPTGDVQAPVRVRPLICTTSGSPSTATFSTRRAVDSLSITPPGGATDSIRCAIPTCSPTAV